MWGRRRAPAGAFLARLCAGSPYETMRHLVGADVLLKSISSFSNVASLYSAGVKLHFGFSPELPPAPLPPALRADRIGPGTPGRKELVAQMVAHMRWRSAHAVEERAASRRG